MAGTLSAHAVPDDLVRKHALPRVISFLVDDEELRNELIAVDPLALFYGFMALNFVSALVLMTSGGAHANDISTGATRFVLVRCDRLSWSLGKLLGHAVLLAVGLLVGAAATGAVAQLNEGFDLQSLSWLLRAVFRAWVYGVAYLGIFCAVSLIVRVPTRARSLSIAVLFALWVGHAATQSAFAEARLPGVSKLGWFFPGHYELLLWSPSWFDQVPAVAALLAIGAGSFALGHLAFRRADA